MSPVTLPPYLEPGRGSRRRRRRTTFGLRRRRATFATRRRRGTFASRGRRRGPVFPTTALVTALAAAVGVAGGLALVRAMQLEIPQASPLARLRLPAARLALAGEVDVPAGVPWLLGDRPGAQAA